MALLNTGRIPRAATVVSFDLDDTLWPVVQVIEEAGCLGSKGRIWVRFHVTSHNDTHCRSFGYGLKKSLTAIESSMIFFCMFHWQE